MRLQITQGDHVPNLPFMVLDGRGFLIDLSKVSGNLWDPTIALVEWGMTSTGEEGGRIVLKDGTGRRFSDRTLLDPYLKAWQAKRAELDAGIAAAANEGV